MGFPQFTPPTALVLLLLLALVIVGLHLLRPRTMRTELASTLLWQRVLQQTHRYNRRWRWWLTLLLALAIGCSTLMAVLFPQGTAASLDPQRVVLVLDNAISMQVRMSDGRTRFAHAAQAAEDWLQRAGSGTQVRVTDSMGLVAAGDFVSPRRALEALRAIPSTGFGTPRLPAVLIDGPVVRHVFTDAVTLDVGAREGVIHRIFEAAENVGITAFDVSRPPGDAARADALVQVFNAGHRKAYARVLLRSEGAYSAARNVELAAGEMVDLTFDASTARGVLAAGVSAPGDAFPLDDIAYAAMPAAGSHEVLLVSPGEDNLQDSLRALPGIHLTAVRPAQYAPQRKYDAYVFDRFAPHDAPPRGSVVFGVQQVPWLPPAGARLHDVGVASWDASHPVSADLQWSNLRLRSAYAIAPSAQALVRSTGGERTLIAASAQPHRFVYAAFALEDANLALQPAFPVFLGHALDWVSAHDEPLRARPGEVMLSMRSAHVTDGSGRALATRTRGASTQFTAAQPDVYTAHADGESRLVIVNIADPRVSQINRSRGPAIASASDPTGNAASPAPSFWVVLLVAACLLLLFDWLAYLRRLTV